VVCEVARIYRHDLAEDELRSHLLAHVLRLVERYDTQFRFRPYAAQRFRWLARSEARKRRRRHKLLEATKETLRPNGEVLSGLHASTGQDTPESQLIAKRRVRRLHMAVKRLSSRHATVIRRHFLEDQSCERIARQLGVSRSSVYRMRREAIDALGEQLRARERTA
jgi:RNA polymerase sigma factor (sigma-70 family)